MWSVSVDQPVDDPSNVEEVDRRKARRIRARRESLGLSREKLAAAAEVSASTIKLWESEAVTSRVIKRPSQSKLSSILAALDRLEDEAARATERRAPAGEEATPGQDPGTRALHALVDTLPEEGRMEAARLIIELIQRFQDEWHRGNDGHGPGNGSLSP